MVELIYTTQEWPWPVTGGSCINSNYGMPFEFGAGYGDVDHTGTGSGPAALPISCDPQDIMSDLELLSYAADPPCGELGVHEG